MIVALNNKSNLNKEEFLKYQKELASVNTKHTLILCPTMLNIPMFNLENCILGSQNVSKDDNGAHTGEVSAQQLASHNTKYCIVGHSERRQELLETDEDINKKIKMLFKNSITPILCVGETKEERENDKVAEVITNEVVKAISELTEEEKTKIVVAYEPIWSIGTGLIPTPTEIDRVLQIIKEILPNNKILYGGSANEKNINELKECKYIDGYLLGGLSLKVENLKIFIENM